MAVNRATARSTTPGVLSGNSYLDDVSDEIVALWDRAPNVLAITGGTANAMTATITPALTTGFANGMLFTLVPTADNVAGGVTITVGSTTLDLVDRDGNALGAGESKAGRKLAAVFDSGTGQLHVLGSPATSRQIAKGWVKFNGVGTVAINNSLNVSSITDNGVGDYTVNWTAPFANADYAVSVMGLAATPIFHRVISQTTSTLRIFFNSATHTSDSPFNGAAFDLSALYVIAFGD